MQCPDESVWGCLQALKRRWLMTKLYEDRIDFRVKSGTLNEQQERYAESMFEKVPQHHRFSLLQGWVGDCYVEDVEEACKFSYTQNSFSTSIGYAYNAKLKRIASGDDRKWYSSKEALPEGWLSVIDIECFTSWEKRSITRAVKEGSEGNVVYIGKSRIPTAIIHKDEL